MREKLLHFWLKVAGRNRRVAALDFCLLALSVYLGFALRLTILITPEYYGDLAVTAAAFPFCVTFVLWLSGVYRVHWPQASVEEYARLARSYLLGAALFLCANFFSKTLSVPRTSLAIMLFAGIVFIGSMRASWRLSGFYALPHGAGSSESRRTVIIGAGEAGAYLARDLLRRGAAFSPVGFIDSDPQKRGKTIAGLAVLGDDDELISVCKGRDVKVALIAIPSASGARVRKYLDALSALNVEVRVLPNVSELAGGRIEIGSLRSVELQDLLRREPIRLDEAEIASVISGKRILVTGAGGSIGSEICAQLAKHGPAEIFLLGHGEQSIYNLMQQLGDAAAAKYRPIIADIADVFAMERVFGEHRPEIVFHAGAHKHVPLMEENPREALRVNAFGTWTVADRAGAWGAERVVMISTDKAVHPSSVMGATKRVAERLLRCAQQKHPGTRYIAVRFGNVLGSRGSVVPLFEKQIMKGGPITVTHPDMRRYFMLIPEAVSLVLQAAAMGRGGELYVLDMGEPVNIAAMAETLIRLHGREPHTDVRIEFTGIRKGEKLFEELFYDPAHVDTTSHEKIFLSRINEEAGFSISGVEELLGSPLGDDELRSEIFALAGAERQAE
ncbi:MAG: polysaccharide biosynthesis protein [Synergistaceae bacterium]|jgi:FlaA1/EpsC-like NDP-sugar epimerase|nr:polysaccharide biosynthesis protein [Synergistaceae bacterium]